MEMYIHILRDKFQESILFSHGSDLVLIINHEKNDIDYVELEKICREFHQVFKLQCGISEMFYAFMHIQHYYNQSLIALTEGGKCHPERSIYAFRDYYRHKLVQCLEESVDIKAFCHPSMLQILEEKNENDLALLRTLQIYLLYGKNRAQAAEELHIHRNTLAYRLTKVSDILHIDIENMDSITQWYIMMSCFFVEYLTDKG